jgi:hypothetical protein
MLILVWKVINDTFFKQSVRWFICTRHGYLLESAKYFAGVVLCSPHGNYYKDKAKEPLLGALVFTSF